MKFIVSLFFILFINLASGQTKAELKSAGDSLANLRNYKGMIEHFSKLYNQNPDNETIVRYLALGYMGEKQLDSSEKYYLEAIALNDTCVQCFINLGQIHALRNDFTRALYYDDLAISVNPDKGSSFIVRAQIKQAKGDMIGAITDYDHAIDMEPKNGVFYLYRALFYMNDGLYSIALSDLDDAIRFAPKNYAGYFYRSNIYYAQGRVNKALDDINQAISLDSTAYELFTGRGAIYHYTEEYEKALKDYTRAIQIDSSKPFAYLNRGQLLYSIEDMDGSCRDYRNARMRIVESNTRDRSMTEEIQLALANHCDSSNPSFYFQRGIAYYNLEKYHESVRVYQLALKKFPSNAMILFFLGNAYAALYDFENALQYYELSLERKDSFLPEINRHPTYANLDPSSKISLYQGFVADAYHNLAKCHLHTGSFKEALVAINEAIKAAPAIQEIQVETYYDLRGRIYMELEMFEDASADINKAIELNRDYAMAYISRAILKVSMADNVKLQTVYIKSNINNQPMQVSWTYTNKNAAKKVHVHLESALNDCNAALALQPDLAFAYYIRGQIKMMLLSNDYCLDLHKARNMGMMVNEASLTGCK